MAEPGAVKARMTDATVLQGDALETRQQLVIVPVSFAEACTFVDKHHRHHVSPQGHKFSVGVADEDGTIRGVAIVGRPTARMSSDGWTLEVVRVATDGCPNACSALYGAAWRAAKALGYKRLITYTLPEEGGASLRGAGFQCLGEAGGGSWGRRDRPRVDKHPTLLKVKWERRAQPPLFPEVATANAGEAKGES